MIRAILNPIVLIGVLLAFVIAMVARGVAQRAVAARVGVRRPIWNPAEDFDIFGIVAAVMGGTGWGRRVDSSGFRGPNQWVLLAGPLTILLLSQVVFAIYALLGGPAVLGGASEVLWGSVPFGTGLDKMLLGLGVGLLYAGLLALVPLPPLDGWGLVRHHYAQRRSEGFQKAELWLDEKNIGLVILFVGLVLPLVGLTPVFLFVLDVLTAPILALWAG